MRTDTKEKVDFSRAILRTLDLFGANFVNFNLTHADLTSANLTSANLTDADLRWANLENTNLTKANLQGANLRDAIYNDDTIFPDGFDPKKEGMDYKPSEEKEST